MSAITNNPFFGLTLTTAAYLCGLLIAKRFKSPLANQYLISVLLVTAIMLTFKIPVDHYFVGADTISMFLAPATAMLAVSIYNQLHLLKANLLPVLCGCLAGAITSVGSILLMSHLFGLNDALTVSLVPKSVTTPIAMGLSQQYGGIPAISVAAVIVTGILGAIGAPWLIKLFRIKSPIASGVALGSSAHALGTVRALELGETQGAMSSVSIGISGLITVLLAAIVL